MHRVAAIVINMVSPVSLDGPKVTRVSSSWMVVWEVMMAKVCASGNKDISNQEAPGCFKVLLAKQSQKLLQQCARAEPAST